MPNPDDLLEQAKHLANREKKRPRQAVSAKGCVRCLLCTFSSSDSRGNPELEESRSACFNWALFEHGKMKAASDEQRGADLDCVNHLQRVADAFFQAQQQRHTADYDNSKAWTRTEVLARIAIVDSAFKSWRSIRDESLSQTYLVSVLVPP